MYSHSPEERKARIAVFLAHQRTGVLCCVGYEEPMAARSVWAMPVRYHRDAAPSHDADLTLDCLVPRWADITLHLTQQAEVLLIVQASPGAGLRWAQIRGIARPVEAPDWQRWAPSWLPVTQAGSLYTVVRVIPNRIDLFDEDLSWGVRETLEW